MSNYTFRGNPITGSGAYALLKAIKRVMKEAPNFTQQDIAALEIISEDFMKRFTEDLQKSYVEGEYDTWVED